MLYLFKKNDCFCYGDNHRYEFKETVCGRFFVWKSKFKSTDIEVTFQYNRTEEEKKVLSHEKYYEQLEKNREMGTCFEVGKYSYKSILKEEKKSQSFLESNLKFLDADGKNPDNVQIYVGTTEDNAKKKYDKTKYPYCWGYVIGRNNYGQLYVVEMIENSDHFFDDKGKEITYDRNFFDSINYNDKKTEKILKEIKKYLESRKEKDIMSFYEDVKDIENPTSLMKKFNQLKIELYFMENAKRMEIELKKLIPDSKKIIDTEITYSLTFNASDKTHVNFSAYYKSL